MLPELEDPCEDCGAPAGAFCWRECPSGYTADDHRRATQPPTTDD